MQKGSKAPFITPPQMPCYANTQVPSFHCVSVPLIQFHVCLTDQWLLLLFLQCMSPTFLHLRCAVGECGPVVQGGSDNCPTPCFANSQCSHCLRQAWCGWCPVPNHNHNGTGICLSGGLREPTDGVCTSAEISWDYEQALPGEWIDKINY